MTLATDRRSVLTGLGALALGGCVGADEFAGDVIEVPMIDLTELEARHGGRIGIVAEGQGGGAAHWRANERFTYCSTFKLFLAAATLDRVVVGQERLDRPVPITADDLVSHAPVTQRAVGTSLTVEQLMQATVEVSDNPAANILIREMGGLDALRAWYRSIGDEITQVDRLEPGLNAFAPGDIRDTTTPRQAVRNINEVFFSYATARAHRPLREPYRQLLERWLIDSPTGAGRIKAGVPAGYRVAHKTGTNSDGPTNDIGVIFPPSRHHIPIAVYYQATAASTPAQRDAVIADATRLALAALGHGAAA